MRKNQAKVVRLLLQKDARPQTIHTPTSSFRYMKLNHSPSNPNDIIAAQAPAIKPPGLLPAIVGET